MSTPFLQLMKAIAALRLARVAGDSHGRQFWRHEVARLFPLRHGRRT